MAPTKPILHPLKTPRNMHFPSELRERTYHTSCLDSIRPPPPDEDEKHEHDEDDEDTAVCITPPPAYTEFLNTFSPIFSSPATSRANFSKYMMDRPRPSPTSEPSSATSTTFSSKGSSYKYTTETGTPYSAAPWSAKSPSHLRRLRLPPPYIYSPAADSPRSAYTIRSPYTPSDWKMKHFDSPVSESGRTISIRHVVTTTVTLKRAPQLDPPPPGKRRDLGRRHV